MIRRDGSNNEETMRVPQAHAGGTKSATASDRLKTDTCETSQKNSKPEQAGMIPLGRVSIASG
jgi:hypothetical protein